MSYIGITTKSLEWRWKQHLKGISRGAGNCRYLTFALIKYGPESFTQESIACASSIEGLKELERILIVQHGTVAPLGFNLCGGGEGVFNPSPDTRSRMSASALARTDGRTLGRKFSQEHREALVVAHTGKKHVAGQTDKIRRANSGRIFSPESKMNMSAGRIGMVFSDEHKANMSKVRIGIGHTTETRAGMAISQKRRREREMLAKGRTEPLTPNEVYHQGQARRRNATALCWALVLHALDPS